MEIVINKSLCINYSKMIAKEDFLIFTQYVIIHTLFGYIRWGYPFYIDFLESKKKYKRRERERERERGK